MDTTDLGKKLGVRTWVAERIGRPWRVLDLYCGQGEVYRRLWHEAEEYLGVDKFNPHQLAQTVKCSAERAVQEFELDGWNIYDLDTYSSPWVVARRILRRRGPGRFGLCLTWGGERGLRSTGNEIVRRTIGASGLSDHRLLCRYRDLVTLLMLRSLGEMPGIKLEAAVQARTDTYITYLGLVAVVP